LALFSKATMPVLLDTLGIVGFDHMYGVRLLGQLNRQLTEASPGRVCAPDLIVFPGAKKVDESVDLK
jgi:hypothetical protein